MFGDYSSAPYRPAQRFSSVRMQQGRVWLDSDWNTQVELDAYRRRLTTADTIGCCGVPAGAAGFGLTLVVASGAGADLLISPGRAYAGGILCELPAGDTAVGRVTAGGIEVDRAVVDGRPLAVGAWLEVTTTEATATAVVRRVAAVAVSPTGTVAVTFAGAVPGAVDTAVQVRRVVSYLTQPELPGAPPLAPGTAYVAYLDVWERHLTALEAPELREVALGGPDTTTRTAVVGQVRLHPWTAAEPPDGCVGLGPCWTPPGEGTPGRLAARATPDETADGPCVVPADAGYRRLENQSYVVSVRDGGASFVFSRDHGAVVHGVVSVAADGTVRLVARPLDAYRTLRVGDHVEWVDDQATLTAAPGPIVEITAVDDGGTVVRTNPLLPARSNAEATATHAQLRRWDGPVQPLVTDAWLPLEDGIEIRFEAGGTHRNGDGWVIPARTAIDGPNGDEGGDVLWPRDGDAPRFEPAHFTAHRFLPLAVLRPSGGTWTVEDCRAVFVPVAQQVAFDLVGGDGQNAAAGSALPAPLQVRVSRGGRPLVGAAVQFGVTAGGGALNDPQPVLTTGDDGVASTRWRLGGSGPQTVEARLLDATGTALPGAIAVFAATVAQPAQGGCTHSVGPGGEFRSLAEALQVLAERGEEQVCLCLVAGMVAADLERIDATSLRSLRSVTIGGCGPQSILVLPAPMVVRGLRRLHLHDLAVVADLVVDAGRALLTVEGCREVVIERCWLAATTTPPVPRQRPAGSTLQLDGVGAARIRDCVVEASFPGPVSDRPPAHRIVDGTLLQEPFLTQEQSPIRFAGPVFAELAEEAARRLAEDEALRNETAKQVGTMAREFADQLSIGERTAYGRFAALAPVTKDPSGLVGLIEAIRRAWLRAEGGVALVLTDDRRPIEDPFKLLADTELGDNVIVAGSEVIGSLSLVGPATLDELDPDTLKRIDARATDNLLDAQGPTVRLEGNQIGRVLVGFATLQTLQPQALRRLQNVPARLQLDGNTVCGSGHLLVGGRLTVSGNQFTWSSVARVAGPVTGAPRPLGAGVADTAVYSANQADLASSWVSAARADANAANLQIQL